MAAPNVPNSLKIPNFHGGKYICNFAAKDGNFVG